MSINDDCYKLFLLIFINFREDREIALVYFRAAYAPSHFKSEKEWKALERIELSKAVMCPDVATFLAGMKKTQEFLYREEEHLKKLCNYDQKSVNAFQAVMAEFLDLNNPVGITS